MNQFILQAVYDALKEYSCHSLDELNGARLMNRVDSKFLVSFSTLPLLLELMQQYYTILEINGQRCFHYRSTYFDTHQFTFYNQHHRGKLNRHKVRVREYLDTETSYLEVKFKNNKGRTNKQRIELQRTFDGDISSYIYFLENLGVPHATSLLPSQQNSYTRIALANERENERVTLDINLQSTMLCQKTEEISSLPGLAIAEVKQCRLNRHSPFFRIMRELGIRKRSYSKYCMGMALAGGHQRLIKTNRFKPVIRYVERIINQNLMAC